MGGSGRNYVSDLPRYKVVLVVKKSGYLPYTMDVDKSGTKGASVGRPMEVLKVVVRALKSVVDARPMLARCEPDARPMQSCEKRSHLGASAQHQDTIDASL